uniref:Uncharacterized protein n=1 Tax=Lotharella oceanica TaxID=641309 RepID=A0A7S2XCP4_9EUKA|mmetsp:Transcript_29590/g.55357  ORF Transcript_29590/g.55357 Transcript_29590/m.55357 type:complete len:181 (+) Transcript_29590:63-605(+)
MYLMEALDFAIVFRLVLAIMFVIRCSKASIQPQISGKYKFMMRGCAFVVTPILIVCNCFSFSFLGTRRVVHELLFSLTRVSSALSMSLFARVVSVSAPVYVQEFWSDPIWKVASISFAESSVLFGIFYGANIDWVCFAGVLVVVMLIHLPGIITVFVVLVGYGRAQVCGRCNKFEVSLSS